MKILLIIPLILIINFVIIKLLFRWRHGFKECHFHNVVAWWIKRSYNNGVIVIKPFGSKFYTLRFIKYISDSGDYGMSLAFPTNIVQEKYLSGFHDYCVREKLNVSVRENHDRKILLVDFGKDTAKAVATVKYVFFELFKLRAGALFCFCFINVGCDDREITDPTLSARKMGLKAVWKSSGLLSRSRLNALEKNNRADK